MQDAKFAQDGLGAWLNVAILSRLIKERIASYLYHFDPPRSGFEDNVLDLLEGSPFAGLGVS